MSLQLSPEQLRTALAGLSLADKTELLRLLQLRERLEAEKPIDNRPSLESFVNEARDQAAAKSSDPAAYVAAWDAHLHAVVRYSDGHARECQGPTQLSLDGLLVEFREATAAATAAGCPPAWEVVPPPELEQPPEDPLDRLKRATLPRATQRDLADSQTRHGETATYDHIIAEQKRATTAPDQEDKLRWFRDQSPPGVPPSWPDS
jgi:hypothetical protein